ncbi:MAG: hypothetical protein IT436_07820 [Phycisphaerales bacterium]|nr:hypothetical protein [Phycisphaerales bacterium]
MKTGRWCVMAGTVAMAGLTGPPALGQTSVFVDFAGVSISSLQTSPPDVVRTSAGMISAAPGYLFEFAPIVEGTGFLGTIVIPDPTPLGDVLNTFVPGQQRILKGAMRHPPATHPVQLDYETVAGTFSGFDLNLTFVQNIRADHKGEASIRNIQKPFGLGLSVVSGGATYTTWTPPAPVRSEWHFDGDLLSVKESGLAPASGPAKIRYLDDSRLGPILGGPGELTGYPTPATPQNITQAQSAFGTTTSFGIPGPGGAEDIVYRTSPARNLSDPTNPAKSRGIGLALWPNSRDFWPEDRNGQWTMVWDLYIPPAAWSASHAVALIQDNHNNDGDADSFIRNVGGQAVMGYQSALAGDITVPQIQPGQWFRLALSSDGYRTKLGRVFVNGAYVGTTGGDWLYASTKSNDPRYGDVGSANPLGTAVLPATWTAWGQFPSPWAQAPNPTLAPMASTVCLFADLFGRSEAVYVANFLYADEAMSDDQIAALGGPSAAGIAYLKAPPCLVDLNGDGIVDFGDYLEFLNLYDAQDPRVDFNMDGIVDFGDYLEFLNLYDAGC